MGKAISPFTWQYLKFFVLNQNTKKYLTVRVTHQFEKEPKVGVGYREFMLLSDLYEASNEYFKDDTMIVPSKI
ncbi:hypothetical protein LWI29_030992 [Acer saccharum]|uniref:MATH domain-containing protein n=1 Tax=Acer saccharum TaxID=4024 RepID=A0AA39VEL7_ACESA|nr:hypothetical protein LWI29_030992 [Acer saccharum]